MYALVWMSQWNSTFCTAKQSLCLRFSGCPVWTTPSFALQTFVQVSGTLCTEDCHLEELHTVIDMQVSTDGPYITTTDGWTVRFWDAASFNPIKEVGLSFGVECASLLERTNMWWVARMRAFFCACINLCNMGWYSARIPQKYATNYVAECDQ